MKTGAIDILEDSHIKYEETLSAPWFLVLSNKIAHLAEEVFQIATFLRENMQ